MARRERPQLLSRLRAPEVRAAELLRILHESPPGLGDLIFNVRVYDRMVDRRAIEKDLMYEMMRVDGVVVRRPSMTGIRAVLEGANLLLLMGLARKPKPGLYVITPLGRIEAQAWFPELRPTDEPRTNAKALAS